MQGERVRSDNNRLNSVRAEQLEQLFQIPRYLHTTPS